MIRSAIELKRVHKSAAMARLASVGCAILNNLLARPIFTIIRLKPVIDTLSHEEQSCIMNHASIPSKNETVVYHCGFLTFY
jgi:predicted metallopeptidase